MLRCPFKKKCIKELEEVKEKLAEERALVRSRENLIGWLDSKNVELWGCRKALLAENEQLKEAAAIKTVRIIS